LQKTLLSKEENIANEKVLIALSYLSILKSAERQSLSEAKPLYNK
jgi:hypothetical protein